MFLAPSRATGHRRHWRHRTQRCIRCKPDSRGTLRCLGLRFGICWVERAYAVPYPCDKGGKVRAESLREAVRARPFKPFSLMLADGTRLPVTHPEWILVPPGARTAVLMDRSERVRILDVALL